MSWNGATDVTAYVVYAGSRNDDLQEVGKVEKKGFETEFVTPKHVKFVQVVAIEDGGEAGRSGAVAV